MKLVRAYVRNFMVGKVLDALRALNVPRVTVVDVKALGDEISPDQLEMSARMGSAYTTMVKIEAICNNDCVDRIKKAIMTAARTGYKGDGLIAVSPIEEAISIRTGKKAVNG